jgi:general secretion pathway protein J
MNSATTISGARRGERGFTLIELLVSLTILGTILALLGGALRVMSKNWDANAERIDTLDMVSRAADILQRDTAGLQRVIALNGGTPYFVFTGTVHQLSFVTLEPPYPTASGPYFVDYSVAANGPARELVRARARYEHGMQTFPGATPANRVSLGLGNYEFRFAYASKRSGATQWQDTWPHNDQLPDMIRLQMIDMQRKQPVSAPVVVTVPADAELACLGDKAKVCSAKSGGALKKLAQSTSTAPAGNAAKANTSAGKDQTKK